MALVFRHAPRVFALLLGATAAFTFLPAPRTTAAPAVEPRSYLPLVVVPAAALPAVPPASLPTDWLSRVNYYRALAGVPPLSDDPLLSMACREHSHALAAGAPPPSQPTAPAAMPCADHGVTWSDEGIVHTPLTALDAWMRSPEQRQWLLYPTTTAFGFGFTLGSGQAAAALDARSAANFAADAAFSGWPVRYPGSDQIGVAPDRVPLTLLWRRDGPAPRIDATALRTAPGDLISHEVALLPGGHQGVQLVPLADLPERTMVVVEVSGTYQGVPFSERWQFTTGERFQPNVNERVPAPDAPLPPMHIPTVP
jgi:hypothetical protein